MSAGLLPNGLPITGTVMDVWLVYETVDEYGRRGSLLGAYSLESLAKKEALGKGWYGGTGAIVKAVALRLADGKYVAILSSEGAVRLNTDLPTQAKADKAAALAKLTPEEIQLLGIKT